MTAAVLPQCLGHSLHENKEDMTDVRVNLNSHQTDVFP